MKIRLIRLGLWLVWLRATRYRSWVLAAIALCERYFVPMDPDELQGYARFSVRHYYLPFIELMHYAWFILQDTSSPDIHIRYFACNRCGCKTSAKKSSIGGGGYPEYICTNNGFLAGNKRMGLCRGEFTIPISAQDFMSLDRHQEYKLFARRRYVLYREMEDVTPYREYYGISFCGTGWIQNYWGKDVYRYSYTKREAKVMATLFGCQYERRDSVHFKTQ